MGDRTLGFVLLSIGLVGSALLFSAPRPPSEMAIAFVFVFLVGWTKLDLHWWRKRQLKERLERIANDDAKP